MCVYFLNLAFCLLICKKKNGDTWKDLKDVDAFSREPGAQDGAGKYKLGVNGETEVRGIATAEGHAESGEGPFGSGLGLFSQRVVPSSGLGPQGQPAIPLPREGLRQAGGWSDLSSCGLTKASRSWISMKHVLMTKPGPKVTSRACRKEGSRGLGRPPSSSSSSLDTVFPAAAAALCLAREEGAVGRNGPREAWGEWGGEGSCFLDDQEWEGDGQDDSPGHSVLRCPRGCEWYPNCYQDDNPAMASLRLAAATPGRMLSGRGCMGREG